jgi:16S rRNA G966 N2-methylase RsmD
MPAKPSALLDTRVIYCGDNLDQLGKLPEACVDLIYIDPPFNSSLQRQEDRQRLLRRKLMFLPTDKRLRLNSNCKGVLFFPSSSTNKFNL